MKEELDSDLEAEEAGDDIDEADLDEELDGVEDAEDLLGADADEEEEIVGAAVVVEEDEDEDEAVPARRATDDDEDEEEADPDDVEEDLDAILKERLTSGEDIDADGDDEDPAPAPKKDAEQPEGVTAKKEGEFTCSLCFMIVHPRQFGRASNPTCPEGEEDCPALDIVRARG